MPNALLYVFVSQLMTSQVATQIPTVGMKGNKKRPATRVRENDAESDVETVSQTSQVSPILNVSDDERVGEAVSGTETRRPPKPQRKKLQDKNENEFLAMMTKTLQQVGSRVEPKDDDITTYVKHRGVNTRGFIEWFRTHEPVATRTIGRSRDRVNVEGTRHRAGAGTPSDECRRHSPPGRSRDPIG